MLEMGSEAEKTIRSEGEKAWPNECCGILLGTIDPQAAAEPGFDSVRRRLERIIPIENSREEAEQYHRFEIRSEDLMRAELEARKTGKDVLGFYHSHPDHPAEPSDFDREHALPFYSYVIVSVDRGKAGDLRSWELTPDRAKFLEEEIWR